MSRFLWFTVYNSNNNTGWSRKNAQV